MIPIINTNDPEQDRQILYECGDTAFLAVGVCDLACPGCERWNQTGTILRNISSYDPELVKTEISRAISEGLKIHIGGGEPLILKRLKELCFFIKSEGGYCIIRTHGLLPGAFEKIVPYIDEVEIVVDGNTRESVYKNTGVKANPSKIKETLVICAEHDIKTTLLKSNDTVSLSEFMFDNNNTQMIESYIVHCLKKQ